MTEQHSDVTQRSSVTQATLFAIPIGFAVLSLFILFQRSGVLDLGFEGGMTPVTALLIGVVASFSSCLAVVGGLVLSLAAKLSQDGTPAVRPFFFFHMGRLGGFAFLGGALGFVGASISIHPMIAAGLGILASVVMLLLGIHLLGVFSLVQKLQFRLPRAIFERFTRAEGGVIAPLSIGIGTFFLPCGFTQSMQFVALSSGSFASGMIIMTMFAIGTLPMLALLSFGTFQFSKTRYATLFFKSVGVVVIGFGILSLAAALAGMGIIPPLFTF
jgi:sulfite exporter TauE/SafE